MKETGRLDILVNNAGVTRDGFFMRMSDEDWDLVLNINLRGSALCARSAAKVMFKQRSGKIINISSVIGLIGNAGQANYAASKAGIIGLTRALSKELGSRGIQVNAIAPGFIDTAMTQALPEDIKTAYMKNIPLGRFGSPEEVADLVLFLASPASDYITGQVIAIDGGHDLPLRRPGVFLLFLETPGRSRCFNNRVLQRRPSATGSLDIEIGVLP